MKSVSEGEAAVIRVLLASVPLSERERTSITGLSGRTFERIRRRAYTSGCVFDRLVPSPSFMGFVSVIFVTAHPFAEDLERVQQTWKTHPSNVLLWRGSETIFGVFFSSLSIAQILSSLSIPRGRSEPFVVAAPSNTARIPVYFDFEGAWSRFTSQRGTLAYPHSLPTWSPGMLRASTGQHLDRTPLERMVRRPFRSGAENGVVRVNRVFMPRSERRLIEQQVVEKRTILDPRKVGSFQGRSIDRIAFVMGELDSPGGEVALFRTLIGARVSPFLFASDDSRVLLATLAPAPMETEESGSARPAVLQILQRHLRRIQIVREPIHSLSVVVNHRYDRLFQPSP
jgi:hypothetical protein